MLSPWQVLASLGSEAPSHVPFSGWVLAATQARPQLWVEVVLILGLRQGVKQGWLVGDDRLERGLRHVMIQNQEILSR